jgi:hypothetical protein
MTVTARMACQVLCTVMDVYMDRAGLETFRDQSSAMSCKVNKNDFRFA